MMRRPSSKSSPMVVVSFKADVETLERLRELQQLCDVESRSRIIREAIQGAHARVVMKTSGK